MFTLAKNVILSYSGSVLVDIGVFFKRIFYPRRFYNTYFQPNLISNKREISRFTIFASFSPYLGKRICQFGLYKKSDDRSTSISFQTVWTYF